LSIRFNDHTHRTILAARQPPSDSLNHAPTLRRAAELAMASALKIIAGKDLMNDRELMASAIELERRALRVIMRGLPKMEAPSIAT
jgi:hypothetical protein